MANSKLSSVSSNLETITKECNKKQCILCGRSTVDKFNLGPLYSKNGVICHYYCLLFCCNLQQKGTDDSDGIMAFLTTDIRKEVKRVKLKNSKNYEFYKCSFCRKPGATIGCYVTECGMKYHFPCGLKHGVNFRFTSEFASYCKNHADLKIFTVATFINRQCPVCSEPLNENDKSKLVTGRCCSSSMFHKECLQPYALNAGSHFFKCPTCADKATFVADAKLQGIFVPEKDAEWELEDSFRDLRQRYSQCDAPKCLCPNGRNYNDRTETESEWFLLGCASCAASGMHKKCSSSPAHMNIPGKWLCEICRVVMPTINDSSGYDDDDESIISISSTSSSSKDNSAAETDQEEVNSGSSEAGSLFSLVRAGYSGDKDLEISSTSSESLFSVARPQQRHSKDKDSSDSSSESLFSVVRLPLRKVLLEPPFRKIPRTVTSSDEEANKLNGDDDPCVDASVSSDESLFTVVSRPKHRNQKEPARSEKGDCLETPETKELRRSSRKRKN